MDLERDYYGGWRYPRNRRLRYASPASLLRLRSTTNGVRPSPLHLVDDQREAVALNDGNITDPFYVVASATEALEPCAVTLGTKRVEPGTPKVYGWATGRRQVVSTGHAPPTRPPWSTTGQTPDSSRISKKCTHQRIYARASLVRYRGQVRTTVRLDPEVAAAAERLSQERHIGLGAAVNELARAGIARTQQNDRPVPFSQRTAPVGLKVDVTNIGDVLELLDSYDQQDRR